MLIYRWRRSSFFDISTEIIAYQLRRWRDAGLMLGQRLRRCLNIKAALGQHLVFAACHSPARDRESDTREVVYSAGIPLKIPPKKSTSPRMEYDTPVCLLFLRAPP